MDWMDANQLGRRNLKPDQRSLLRGRRYNRTKKAAHSRPGNAGGKRESQSDTPAPDTWPCHHCGGIHVIGKNPCHGWKEGEPSTRLDTATTLAQQHGVSRATVIRDGKRAEAIEKLAESQPEQAQLVRDGLKRFNLVRREIKLEEVKKSVALPTAKYRVIYADPPWKYGDQLTEDYGAVKFHYPAMTIAELCAMPIRDVCEPDAVLFLWVTSPLLEECFPIINAWGFKYKTSFVWDKVKHNMGHYNSVRHELLLICTRGSCTPDTKKLNDSVQSIERTTHSTKPEKFREIIEELYPHGKRLELFARKQTEGWTAYGNQS